MEQDRTYPPGEIPASLIASWELVPADVHATLFMRHSYRPSIPRGVPDVVDLSEEGVQLARELGARFRSRRAGRLLASKVPRCVSTAKAFAEGAGWSSQPTVDERLRNPWTLDDAGRELARGYWSAHPRTIDALRFAMSTGIPGWRPFGDAVAAMVDAMIEAPSPGALDVLVTHDLMVGAVVEWLLRPGLDKTPRLLEGVFVWRVEAGIAVAWRGEVREIPWPPR